MAVEDLTAWPLEANGSEFEGRLCHSPPARGARKFHLSPPPCIRPGKLTRAGDTRMLMAPVKPSGFRFSQWESLAGDQRQRGQ
jgi:hypothetical protein